VKNRLLIAAFCAVALPMSGLADDAHHPDENKAKPAASKLPSKGAMHEHMKRMQEQMARIRAENDPVKRGELIDEHMKTMHESMSRMQGMKHDKGGMMGGKGGMSGSK
jgi:hypothetical protein